MLYNIWESHWHYKSSSFFFFLHNTHIYVTLVNKWRTLKWTNNVSFYMQIKSPQHRYLFLIIFFSNLPHSTLLFIILKNTFHKQTLLIANNLYHTMFHLRDPDNFHSSPHLVPLVSKIKVKKKQMIHHGTTSFPPSLSHFHRHELTWTMNL